MHIFKKPEHGKFYFEYHDPTTLAVKCEECEAMGGYHATSCSRFNDETWLQDRKVLEPVFGYIPDNEQGHVMATCTGVLQFEMDWRKFIDSPQGKFEAFYAERSRVAAAA